MTDEAQAPLRGVMQVAYVTADMARAQRKFGEIYGIGEFFEIKNLSYQARDGDLVVNIALSYVGPVQIEIIEPIGGTSTFYSAFLPEPPQVARFHHVNWFFENEQDFESKKASLSALGKSFPVDVQVAGANVFYCDIRDDLGHYLEAVAPIGDEPLVDMPIPRF